MVCPVFLYLLAPVFHTFCKERRQIKTAVFIVLLLAVKCVIVADPYWNSTFGKMHSCFISALLGSLHASASNKKETVGATLVTILTYLAWTALALISQVTPPLAPMSIPKIEILSIAILCVFVFFGSNPQICHKVQSFLAHVGGYSYEVYLTHSAFISVYFSFSKQNERCVFVNICVYAVIVVLSYFISAFLRQALMRLHNCESFASSSEKLRNE